MWALHPPPRSGKIPKRVEVAMFFVGFLNPCRVLALSAAIHSQPFTHTKKTIVILGQSTNISPSLPCSMLIHADLRIPYTTEWLSWMGQSRRSGRNSGALCCIYVNVQIILRRPALCWRPCSKICWERVPVSPILLTYNSYTVLLKTGNAACKIPIVDRAGGLSSYY